MVDLSTCQDGKEFDRSNGVNSCKGHEAEFDKKHGISGAGLFFAIVLPIAAAAGVGYWVWRNWEGKFGSIRLGDGMAPGFSGGSGAFDREAPWIKYPVVVLSGLVAVVAAIPMVVGTVWRTVMTRFGRSGGRFGGGHGGWSSGPYTSRSSFARGGGYAVVDPDEGELLGDESDDDV